MFRGETQAGRIWDGIQLNEIHIWLQAQSSSLPTGFSVIGRRSQRRLPGVGVKL
jgi:hypothetical protein